MQMLSFEWNDGTKKSAGAEFEGLTPVVYVNLKLMLKGSKERITAH